MVAEVAEIGIANARSYIAHLAGPGVDAVWPRFLTTFSHAACVVHWALFPCRVEALRAYAAPASVPCSLPPTASLSTPLSAAARSAVASASRVLLLIPDGSCACRVGPR